MSRKRNSMAIRVSYVLLFLLILSTTNCTCWNTRRGSRLRWNDSTLMWVENVKEKVGDFDIAFCDIERRSCEKLKALPEYQVSQIKDGVLCIQATEAPREMPFEGNKVLFVKTSLVSEYSRTRLSIVSNAPLIIPNKDKTVGFLRSKKVSVPVFGGLKGLGEDLFGEKYRTKWRYDFKPGVYSINVTHAYFYRLDQIWEHEDDVASRIRHKLTYSDEVYNGYTIYKIPGEIEPGCYNLLIGLTHYFPFCVTNKAENSD